MCSALTSLIAASLLAGAAGETLVPVIEGPWWQVAGNPDLGPYTSPQQQPVDFGVWQAADGTWQLWSCIRHTRCGGNTRLFYRWEGKNLTDANWAPKGIAMEARTDLGESRGGLQAPHVVKVKGIYHMAYGDWVNICFATSADGKRFERVIRAGGKTGAFSEGPRANTRDPMLIKIGELWHCYYTGSSPSNSLGYIYCRTSPDLEKWSPSCVVCYGGLVGNGRWITECPHVVEPGPGWFYLFRNQYYGRKQRNWVYRSNNPLHFAIDDDTNLVCSLPVAAPEIIHHEGKYYIAALNPDLDGIRIARLKWAPVDRYRNPLFDLDDPGGRAGWRLVEGNLEGIFWAKTHAPFNARTKHVIGTSELQRGGFDDALTGIIESPPFRLEAAGYELLVSGGNDPRRLYVAIVDVETGTDVARFTGRQSNVLTPRFFTTGDHAGKQVRLRIVDKDGGGWGHINFGGIYSMP